MPNTQKLRENLEKRDYQTSFFPTAQAAAAYLAREIHGCTVGIGGSITVEQMGLYETLSEQNQVFWHWKDKSADILRLEDGAQIYLSSANAVSENGEIVNIDSTGNRLVGTICGPEKVYIIIGTNKIEPDLERAIWRARNIASPLNAKRLGRRTPCALAAETRCYDCDSPERICQGLLVLWGRMKGVGACEVVIIDQNLGY